MWEQVKGGKCRRWSMKSVNTQSGRHSIWPFNEECRHSMIWLFKKCRHSIWFFNEECQHPIWLFNEVSTLNLAFQWKVSTFIFSEKPTPVSALNFADKKCTLSVDESLNLWKVKTQACWLGKVGYYKVSAGDWWRALQKCQRKQVSAWLIGNSPRKCVLSEVRVIAEFPCHLSVISEIR